jgi:hypothetical protein
MPDLYWNSVLFDGAGFFLVVALALLIGSLVLKRFSKRRMRLAALAALVASIALAAAHYGLIFAPPPVEWGTIEPRMEWEAQQVLGRHQIGVP